MPSDATEAALGLLGLTTPFTHSAPPPSSSTSPTVPAKRKQPPSAPLDDSPVNTDTINCICGLSYDDGFSIACDSCARWCHAACFHIDESQVPDEWLCWICDPRPIHKDHAVSTQRSRQRPAPPASNAGKRRATSPGVDRKTRKPSGTNGQVAHPTLQQTTSVAPPSPPPLTHNCTIPTTIQKTSMSTSTSPGITPTSPSQRTS
ncbi:hypothetical protein BN946_scf185027.g9 [Trametes cinnabarina]|uniref:PHD-type domain-containing protein n=1 Tax=Pycnoporus cinnabarinus TaxID=5643 RepID=A0A060SPN9_PYCCI|nr:hypothetical protein BN946_scf185027.g9 [Trametes cinnabarina]